MAAEATKQLPAVAKRKPPAAGMGRPKGTPNKTTALLKDAILKAAEKAGGRDGIEGYLAIQAVKNPGPFLALLGKVLPLQIAGSLDLNTKPTNLTDEDLEDIATGRRQRAAPQA